MSWCVWRIDAGDLHKLCGPATCGLSSAGTPAWPVAGGVGVRLACQTAASDGRRRLVPDMATAGHRSARASDHYGGVEPRFARSALSESLAHSASAPAIATAIQIVVDQTAPSCQLILLPMPPALALR